VSISLTLERINTMQQESSAILQKPDHLLVNGLKSGKRSAQEVFYKTYFGRMYPIALRYCGSREDAQEVINTAFMKVIESIDKYVDQGKFGAWVRTIVKRSAIDHCRSFKYNHPETFELLDIDSVSYNTAIDNFNVNDILRLLHDLPPASRAVFNLFVFENLSHKEIAQQLEISIGTSKWHLSNARKLLMNLINIQNH